jgi:prepilin-type N-terminal cleavage/methylation domain-containing protein
MDSIAWTPRRGFTLVELLIAIIILLFGVVAALRIFPPGFAAFSDAQMENVAQAQLDNWFNNLAENADSLPDAILPVDMSATSAIISQLDFHDLRAVSYVPGLTDSWAHAHRYALGGSDSSWPLWQPLSTRILRRVIGEKVAIPSDVNAFRDPDDTSVPPTSYNLARFPTYIPRFAPIEADSIQSSLVYDLRYQNLFESGGTIAGLSADDEAKGKCLYYHDDDNPAVSNIFYFKGTVRFVRMTYTCTDGANVVQVAPAVWRIDDTGAVLHQGRQVIDGQEITATVSGTDPYTVTFNLPGSWSIVGGSQQLNRAYEYVDTDGLTEAQKLTTLHDMTARQFSLYTFPNAQPRYERMTKTLLSMLIFSTVDSGKTVKIDYVVADWGILHDDVTVDNDGYATLTTQPRLGSRPRYPREMQPWGLLEPMTGGDLNVVMTIFDLFTNNVFSVEFDPAAPNRDLGTLEKGYQVNPLLITGTVDDKLLIDMSSAQQKRIRLGVLSSSVDDGGVSRPVADWSTLAGQTFRIYYRAQSDWMVQFFRAPAEFGRASDLPYLGWTNYAQDGGNGIYVPGIYAGQSIAVDYQYRDLCQIVQSDGNTDTVQVDTTRRLAGVSEVQIVEPDGAVHPASPLSIVDINSRLNTVKLSDEITVNRGSFLLAENPDTTPLLRAAGEAHFLPPANPGTGASWVALKHLPAPGTVPTVRGASMVIRALWTQSRRGEAYVVDDDSAYGFPAKMRTISERWREKTAVIKLPPSGN